MKRVIRFAGPVIGIGLFALAIWVLHNELRQFHYHQIIKAVNAVPVSAIGWAFLFTGLNYLALCIYDILAFRYIRNPLSWLKIAFASFIAYAFSNNVGFYTVSGSAVRYRLYLGWGLSTLDIAKVIAFCSVLTFWLGLIAICGIVFVTEPVVIPGILHLPFGSIHVAGWFFIAILAAYVTLTVVKKKPFQFKTWEFKIPSTGLSLSLIGTACLDWILFGAVLYVLLPFQQHGLSFAAFLSIFLLAQLAGIISHVPGGLGVFETVIILLLPTQEHTPSTVSALLIFRGIYFLIPLAVSAVTLGIYELYQRKKQITGIAQEIGRVSAGVIPYVFAVLTFIAGAILLFSGAAPAEHTRLSWLRDFMPLPVIELSHFLGSVAGGILLMLAWGIYRRLDGAYHLAIFLLGAGALFSLIKGLDYEEASILTLMLLLLMSSHRQFYRKTSFVGNRFSPGWIAAIVLVLVASVWLGFFAYRHIDYSHELWWQFSFSGNASRFLRGTVGALLAIVFIGIRMLLAPAKVKAADMKDSFDIVSQIAFKSPKTYSQLALLGDKSFILNEGQDAFIMYGVHGRSWVAMGDPVGPAQAIEPLVWEFRELCDRHAGWPVFYEVDRNNLPLYLDLGLSLMKIGEEARVDLSAFSLDGSSKKSLRHSMHKLEQQGLTFEIIPVPGIPALLPELRAVSDTWLREKNTREKRFSLGCFSDAYISLFPCGIVRNGKEILAFTTIWQTQLNEELSVDLMRYVSSAPAGIMDYLFVKMILWAKEHGYAWFNLGMAPFSGIESRSLAPLWNRLGALLFKYGENFYNFHGVRQYKDKFDPVWLPKYLAAPRGFALPWILRDLSTLISGGMKGIFGK